MRHRAVPVAVALLSLAMAACLSPTETHPSTGPFVGVVETTAPVGFAVTDVRYQNSVRILRDRVGLLISKETEIFLPGRSGSSRRGTVLDLGEGDVIRFWTDGVEFRSLPPQWTATRIDRIR